MLLSIIIPSYNSGERLVELIKRLQKIKIKNIKSEIIIINDASKDPIYNKIRTLRNITYIEHKENKGKGGSVRTGFENARGDILLIQDDDLEYIPEDIPKLIEPIIKKKTEVVYGSRRLNKNNKYSSWTYFFGGAFINMLFRIFLRTSLTDAITGSKVITRNVYNHIKPIEVKGFEIEAELTAKILHKGFTILEIPIRYIPRTHKEGKNIRWHHAFRIIKTLLSYSF